MLNGINLVPDDVRRGWLVRRVRRILYASMLVIAAFGLYVFAGQYAAMRAKDSELFGVEREKAFLSAQSSAYAQLTAKLAAVRQKQAEAKKKMEATGGLAKGRVIWSGVLKRLSADIPKDVWLRALSTSDAPHPGVKRMRILGSSLTNRGITEFVFMLENSGVFTDVTLSYAQKKETAASSIFDFEAYASVRPDGTAAGAGI